MGTKAGQKHQMTTSKMVCDVQLAEPGAPRLE